MPQDRGRVNVRTEEQRLDSLAKTDPTAVVVIVDLFDGRVGSRAASVGECANSRRRIRDARRLG